MLNPGGYKSWECDASPAHGEMERGAGLEPAQWQSWAGPGMRAGSPSFQLLLVLVCGVLCLILYFQTKGQKRAFRKQSKSTMTSEKRCPVEQTWFPELPFLGLVWSLPPNLVFESC